MSKGNIHSNVFEIVSKRDNKSKKNPQLEQYLQAFENVSRTPGEDFHPERDIETSLAHYEKLHDELQKKIEEIYKISETDVETVKKYLSSSKNFSSESWEELQLLRKKLTSQLEKMVPSAKKIREKKESKTGGKTKAKGSFSKRKSWISMD